MNKTVLRDVILIITLLAVSASLFLIFNAKKGAGRSFEITVNGRLYGTYPLDADRVIDVDGLCTVEVKDGSVSVTDAACPGKQCVHSRPIRKSGERIICLPQGVVIRVSGEADADFII
ncbi:MAG: NusG domain II-containing protein [Clostridia bacterium]|nr:NusG domain II-containing protein [Clostridia bacterium]